MMESKPTGPILETPYKGANSPGPQMRPIEIADNYLSKVALDLHAATTGRPMRPKWSQVSPALQLFLKYVYDAVGDPLKMDECSPTPVVKRAVDNGTCWIAFSGGKDGIAAAILAREKGWNPVLYHLKGINRSCPDEEKYAQNAALAMGMPLVIDRVAVSGSRMGFIEMPTKNQVITAFMVARMLEYGGSRFLLGMHGADTPERCQAQLNWSDTTKSGLLWGAYMTELVPGLEYIPLLRNQMHSVALVSKAGLLVYAHGCLAPWRYRKSFRKRAVAKWGDAILPGRCGSCYKCWSEYIMLVALGVVPKTGFYAYSVDSMTRTSKKSGVRGWVGTPEEEYVSPQVVEEFRGTAWPPIAPVSPLPPKIDPPQPPYHETILNMMG